MGSNAAAKAGANFRGETGCCTLKRNKCFSKCAVAAAPQMLSSCFFRSAVSKCVWRGGGGRGTGGGDIFPPPFFKGSVSERQASRAAPSPAAIKTKVALRHSEASSSQNNKTSSYLFMFSRSNHCVCAGRLIRWWKKCRVCVCVYVRRSWLLVCIRAQMHSCGNYKGRARQAGGQSPLGSSLQPLSAQTRLINPSLGDRYVYAHAHIQR